MASVAGRRIIGAFLCWAAVSGLAGCTAALGAGVVASLVAVGAVASRCYDYFDVTVLDAAGRKTCAATVTATNGTDSVELRSCYYAPLTDGRWTLRAALPGYPDALTRAVVEHEHDCARHVQTVELTLAPPRVTPPAPAALAPPAALPAPRASTPAPAMSAEPSVAAPPPAPAAAPAPAAVPSSAPPTSPTPAPSSTSSAPASSSRGAFPDLPRGTSP